MIRDLDSASVAASLAEALRLGAQQVLEMELDDLQVLLLVGEDEKQDLFLYDPMPGGSGLLTQLLQRWREVLDRHLAVKAMEAFDHAPLPVHAIVPVVGPDRPPPGGNTAEQRLARLLQWHHFPPAGQQRINLPPSAGVPYTITDFFYDQPTGERVADEIITEGRLVTAKC